MQSTAAVADDAMLLRLYATLGINQSTVSRRVETGLRRLRERLRNQGATMSAIATLPLLLANGLRERSPHALSSSLTKIGLSGVRAAPPVGHAAVSTWMAA